MELHGYFSEIQKKQNNTYYVYLDKNGKDVIVTEVSNKLHNISEITKFFSDTKYVGIVNKFVKKVELSLSENNLQFQFYTNSD